MTRLFAKKPVQRKLKSRNCHSGVHKGLLVLTYLRWRRSPRRHRPPGPALVATPLLPRTAALELGKALPRPPSLLHLSHLLLRLLQN